LLKTAQKGGEFDFELKSEYKINFEKEEGVRMFIKYLREGIRNSIIIGVPNYDKNNLYMDYENLKSDFTYAERKVKNGQKQKNNARKKQ